MYLHASDIRGSINLDIVKKKHSPAVYQRNNYVVGRSGKGSIDQLKGDTGLATHPYDLWDLDSWIQKFHFFGNSVHRINTGIFGRLSLFMVMMFQTAGWIVFCGHKFVTGNENHC